MKNIRYILSLIVSISLVMPGYAQAANAMQDRTVQYLKDEYSLLKRNLAIVQKLTKRESLSSQDKQDLIKAGKQVAVVGLILLTIIVSGVAYKKFGKSGSGVQVEKIPAMPGELPQPIIEPQLPVPVQPVQEQLPPLLEEQDAPQELSASALGASRIPPAEGVFLPLTESSLSPAIRPQPVSFEAPVQGEQEIEEQPLSRQLKQVKLKSTQQPSKPVVEPSLEEQLQQGRGSLKRKEQPVVEPKPKAPEGLQMVLEESPVFKKQREQRAREEAEARRKAQEKTGSLTVRKVERSLEEIEEQLLAEQARKKEEEERKEAEEWEAVPYETQTITPVVQPVVPKPQSIVQPKPVQQSTQPAPGLTQSAINWVREKITGRRPAVEQSVEDISSSGSYLGESQNGNPR